MSTKSGRAGFTRQQIVADGTRPTGLVIRQVHERKEVRDRRNGRVHDVSGSAGVWVVATRTRQRRQFEQP